MNNDLISRQAAISAIQKVYADTTGRDDKKIVWRNVGLINALHITNALHIIQDLPAAETEQKKGKWNKYYRTHTRDTFHCGECGSCFVLLQGAENMNFCPNCGADMRGEKDD